MRDVSLSWTDLQMLETAAANLKDMALEFPGLATYYI
jgi:hypothetical protein